MTWKVPISPSDARRLQHRNLLMSNPLPNMHDILESKLKILLIQCDSMDTEHIHSLHSKRYETPTLFRRQWSRFQLPLIHGMTITLGSVRLSTTFEPQLEPPFPSIAGTGKGKASENLARRQVSTAKSSNCPPRCCPSIEPQY